MVRASSAIGKLVMFDVEGHPEEYSMRRLLDKQNRIGWYFFFMGFWQKLWAEIQETHPKNLRKKMHIDTWRGEAQLEVWEYTHSLWVYRNKKLHGETLEEK